MSTEQRQHILKTSGPDKDESFFAQLQCVSNETSMKSTVPSTDFKQPVCSSQEEQKLWQVESTDSSIKNDEKDSTTSQRSAMSNAVPTLFFFDWDDTLQPTSFLNHLTMRKDLPQKDKANRMLLQLLEQRVENVYRTELAKLFQLIQSLFKRCLAEDSNNRIVIVTNADKGWIQRSVKTFMPKAEEYFNSFLQVSARSLYEADFPDQPQKWKKTVYAALAQDFIAKHPTARFFSCGDSIDDQDALKDAMIYVKQSRATMVKFNCEPTLEELMDELNFVSEYFTQLLESKEPLVTLNDACALVQFLPVTVGKASRDQINAFGRLFRERISMKEYDHFEILDSEIESIWCMADPCKHEMRRIQQELLCDYLALAQGTLPNSSSLSSSSASSMHTSDI